MTTTSRRRFFVKPVVVRRELDADGNWIELKERLTYEEFNRMASSGLIGVKGQPDVDGMAPTRSVEIDMAQFNIAKILMWVVDWGGPGFTSEDDRPVGYTPSAVRALDPTVGDLIISAIDAHQVEMASGKGLSPTENGSVPR